MNWTFEIRTIRNPDAFLYGLPNRTSGNRTFTVQGRGTNFTNKSEFFTNTCKGSWIRSTVLISYCFDSLMISRTMARF